ncbi:hypothetical protein [Streptomyces griseoaurantiacus]|uniref:hypothetical protein n=1 Tax=Streptomyces griseoaurantiacus TaxID=68213 RepID=UPI0032508394
MGLITSHLTKAEVQELLGVNSFGMWWLIREHETFPASDDHYDPGPFARFSDTPQEPMWQGTQLYRWAAHDPEFQQRGAVLLRPLADDLQPGKWLGYHDTPQGPSIDWHTSLGTIRIVHTTTLGAASAVASDLARSGNPDEVVTVCALWGDMGLSGPALVAADAAWPSIEYEVEWDIIAQLTGQDLPWWPTLLRLPDLIRQWKPGAPAVTAEVPDSDREKILRRAARNDAFDRVAKGALIDMANDIRNTRVSSVETDIEIFGRGRPGRGRSPIIIAARHDSDVHPIPTVENRKLLAAGWSRIAASTEPDAVAALGVARSRDPRLLPYGALTEVPAKPDTVVARWARRLVPCDPIAGHIELAGDRSVDAFFLDPVTGMPAVRTQGDKPRWFFFAPLRLPSGRGKLASAILYAGVWITTTDGQVHPAPCDPREHLWYGDGWGDRPTEAATVIHQLLDDLAADIDLSEHWNAPRGLTNLLNEKHRPGTELSRAALLHARMTPHKRAH